MMIWINWSSQKILFLWVYFHFNGVLLVEFCFPLLAVIQVPNACHQNYTIKLIGEDMKPAYTDK